MWLSVACTLIATDTRHHSGKYVVGEREYSSPFQGTAASKV